MTYLELHKCHNAWVQGHFSGYALWASQLYYHTRCRSSLVIYIGPNWPSRDSDRVMRHKFRHLWQPRLSSNLQCLQFAEVVERIEVRLFPNPSHWRFVFFLLLLWQIHALAQRKIRTPGPNIYEACLVIYRSLWHCLHLPGDKRNQCIDLIWWQP